jgi:hypothetical protein
MKGRVGDSLANDPILGNKNPLDEALSLTHFNHVEQKQQHIQIIRRNLYKPTIFQR